MISELEIFGRDKLLFTDDLKNFEYQLNSIISDSSFLIIGGAGSIGLSVTKEIFKRNPKCLHVIDINENNLVELVRDLRSSFGYIKGEFKTIAIDIGSEEFDLYLREPFSFDYVLNLSALKHVRSERDHFTLTRLIKTNIIYPLKLSHKLKEKKLKKYFCVSSDKATNPVNMMGASKRIMEILLMNEKLDYNISSARFANVAFSDGSLLHGFTERIKKRQPIAAPKDISRYFVTFQESGLLCLFSCIFGKKNEIFFPKLDPKKYLENLSDIASKFVKKQGYEPFLCSSETEARSKSEELINRKYWPCWFFNSETTGEKSYEEFYTDKSKLDMKTFKDIGIIKDSFYNKKIKYSDFFADFKKLILKDDLEKKDYVLLFKKYLNEFKHEEKNKNLDQRM